MKTNTFDFLTSNRFWALIIGSASTILVTSFGQELWYISLGKFLGLVSAGFITLRTIDRNTGDAASVATVSIPQDVTSVTATTTKE